MLLDFAERVAGQFVDQDERARHFKRGEFLAAHGFEVAQIDGARRDYICYRDFAAHAVGSSGHGGFGDAILLLQELLDLADKC